MAEYSRMAKGNFTAAGTNAYVTLPFIPDYVELWNLTNIKTGGAHKVTRAWWDNRLLDGSNNPTMVELYTSGGTVNVFDVIETNGISAFQAGLLLQYGPIVQHNGSPVSDFSISKASPAVVTTVGNHGLNTGDVVIFSNLYQTATTGMQQIAGIPFTITKTAATTFTIQWDTSGSNYTAFNTSTATNNVGSYKQVLYPNLYFPGNLIIDAVTTGATTTIKTTTQHNFQVGQEVGFRIPLVWGPTGLNELPNVLIPGSPIYGYVISVTDMQTFVVNINSTGFTAFNANQAFTSFPGLKWPQVMAVGDVNTGGVQISSGSPLYPSPQFSYAALNDSSTINGPAILGSFVNNTRQGFLIGTGPANTDTASQLLTSGDVVYWHAYLHDFAKP